MSIKISSFILLSVACVSSIVSLFVDSTIALYVSAASAGIALVLFAIFFSKLRSAASDRRLVTVDAVTVDLGRSERGDEIAGTSEAVQGGVLEIEDRLSSTVERLSMAEKRLQSKTTATEQALSIIHKARQSLDATDRSPQKGGQISINEESASAVMETVDQVIDHASTIRSLATRPRAETSDAVRREKLQGNTELRSVSALMRELAEQANVLAINAAIEAARIGKAGAGFGIIAGEVQALSAKMADAAGEVRTLSENVGKSSIPIAEAEALVSNVIHRHREAMEELANMVTGIMEKLSGLRSSIQNAAHLGKNARAQILDIQAVHDAFAAAERVLSADEPTS